MRKEHMKPVFQKYPFLIRLLGVCMVVFFPILYPLFMVIYLLPEIKEYSKEYLENIKWTFEKIT